MKKNAYAGFMALGIVWLIIGFIIYKNMSLWPIGATFFVVGLIGFLIKNYKDQHKSD